MYLSKLSLNLSASDTKDLFDLLHDLRLHQKLAKENNQNSKEKSRVLEHRLDSLLSDYYSKQQSLF